MKGFLGSLCFLENHFLLFVFKENSDGKGKCSFGGCQDSHSVMNLTCLPCPCFECCWTPTHHGSTEILCLWASQVPYVKGHHGKYVYCPHLHCLCACSMTYWISFAKHKVKIKLLRNPDSRAFNQVWPSWAKDPMWLPSLIFMNPTLAKLWVGSSLYTTMLSTLL